MHAEFPEFYVFFQNGKYDGTEGSNSTPLKNPATCQSDSQTAHL